MTVSSSVVNIISLPIVENIFIRTLVDSESNAEDHVVCDKKKRGRKKKFWII